MSKSRFIKCIDYKPIFIKLLNFMEMYYTRAYVYMYV